MRLANGHQYPVRGNLDDHQQQNDQSDKLPFSTGPSFVSGRLDHQRHHKDRLQTQVKNPNLEASRSIFSSRFLQNRHKRRSRRANFYFFKGYAFVSLDTKCELVELSGIEPLTPCLQSRCSPS